MEQNLNLGTENMEPRTLELKKEPGTKTLNQNYGTRDILDETKEPEALKRKFGKGIFELKVWN